MELEQYNLNPQQLLAVSLYLKSMNQTQAARDAGYSSVTVFSKPNVRAAIAEMMQVRARRLNVGAEYVLSELHRVYQRCMQDELVTVQSNGKTGEPEGIYKFDSRGALKALELMGRHLDVKAWDKAAETSASEEQLRERLLEGRKRMNRLQQPVVSFLESQPDEQPVSFLDPQPVQPAAPTDQDVRDRLKAARQRVEAQPAPEPREEKQEHREVIEASPEPPEEPREASPVIADSDCVVSDDDIADELLSPDEELRRLMKHLNTHPRERGKLRR